ncbi:TonB-dependent receptor plug domain-containing protein [Shewanella salipaludis]|uniref:TonB-dependent receptor n=1 Tax=Shewanella salipaludis TaxID=2723052 RepID=A0A972FWL4_9GAMM|nr:TonB-dependent receptor [Shewanella salipaludis]NMH64603.1 TonB-dependent receptor [Shewanella salipaludis]
MTHSRGKTLGLGLMLLGMVSPQLQANTSDEDELLALYGDTEMISIATGSLQSITKAPAVATVINADDIREMGASELDQVLETVPGLHVARSALGYNPIYTFRGIRSNYNPQVLLLINGIPISSLYNGDRGLIWGGMPVNAIERIEVIRGPGSALYGADAFAGVINITTLSGSDITQNEFGVRAGSYDTQDAWGKLAGEWHDFTLGMIVEFHQTDGQHELIGSDLQSGLDALAGTSASNAPGAVSLSRENLDIRLDIVKDNWQFRSGLQRRRNWGNGAGVAEALDPDNRWKSDRFNADLTYHNANFSDFWDLQAQISYFDTSTEAENDMHIFPAGSDLTLIGLGGVYPEGLIGNPESFERHTRANITASYTRLEKHHIRGGIGYVFSDLYKVRETKNFGPDPITGEQLPPGSPVVDVSDTPYVYLQEGNRENTYIYLQDIWHLADDWELTAGLRYDDYSDFGNTTNPRVALVWSSSRKLTTKLLYGKAFRAPAFAETRAINNPVVLGNPDLDPETLSSYELAFDYRATERLRFSLNLFHYDWRDIIKFTADASGNTKTANNAGSQTGKGLELDLDWRINDLWQVKANYAWQDSVDEATDRRTSQVPGSQAYLAANWTLSDRVQLHGQLNWVMSREREALDTRDSIDDYATLDLTLNYRDDNNAWGGSIMLRNLTDTDAREPSDWSNPVAAIPDDLPLEGRNIYAQIYFKF